MNDEPGRKTPVQSVLIMGGLSIAYCTLGRVEAGLDPRPLFHSLGEQRADTA